MASPNAGYAVLQVIPSVRGISEELRRQLVAPAGEAGERAGSEAGSGQRDKIKAGVTVAGAAAGALLVSGINKAIDRANVSSRLQAQLGTTNKVAAQQREDRQEAVWQWRLSGGPPMLLSQAANEIAK